MLAIDIVCSRSDCSLDTSARSRANSADALRSSPAMSLPNSKAHIASAAENPSVSATTAQRSGHGR